KSILDAERAIAQLLAVRDVGPVVASVLPGPLDGDGTRSPTLWRGDLIESIDGQFVSAAGFRQLVESLPPGTAIRIVYRRSHSPDLSAAVPRGDPSGEIREVVFALERRSDWTGTFGAALREGSHLPEAPEGLFERVILQKAEIAQVIGADGGLAALTGRLEELTQAVTDHNALAWVINALRRPLSLDTVERPLGEAARHALGGDLSAAVSLVDLALDNRRLPDAALRLPAWFSPLAEEAALSAALAQARGLVRHHKDHATIGSGQLARSNIAAIRRGIEADPILSHLADLAVESHAHVARVGAAHGGSSPRTDLPPDLREAVTGDVLHFDPGSDGQGPLVVGGPGPNTYDMSRIARVYDVGGDDLYTYGGGEIFVDQVIATSDPDAPAVRRRVLARVVIDLSGNDRHVATEDFAGPATGVFGVSILDDHQGNDVYTSGGVLSIGAGLFGLGILIDRAGDDRYENTGPSSGWSIGAGYYGAGLVIDLSGDDSYLGEKLTQGVGGPRGFGAVIDGAGQDLYRANGPNYPSAYGTPAVFLSMSQGFGYGVRGYAMGGVGGLWDFGGDDRYEAGEFSQGCGYFWSVGILRDAGGNDVYYGNRYSQGSAAHQAAGLLIDDAGDDTYWGMTAASQGAAWDQSVGMLIDRGGNDSYRAGGLSQGSAAQQAVGVLIDLGGHDRYSANEPSQGAGGSNEYHHPAWGVFSFSALIDLGGGDDSYSSPGRRNTATVRTGAVDTANPPASNAWGLCSDE
ncbi:MAG TPA: hypothetical protein PKU91_00885, partial [Phycisphaerales bacterium]|nr:hypothetical protein [Phycisphaerales bacterium]